MTQFAVTSGTRPDSQLVRVLVADDEWTLAVLLSMTLRHEGWNVLSAGDGRTAVEFSAGVQTGPRRP
jgi:CheY-like chemotaxis protein